MSDKKESVPTINHKDADTPEELARWIWGRFVGVPVAGQAWGQEYETLLDRVRRMDRSSFTKGLHEGAAQMKALKAEPSKPSPVSASKWFDDYLEDLESDEGSDLMLAMKAGVVPMLEAYINYCSVNNTEMAEALREIRDHSITFDVDEIPSIAREALDRYEKEKALTS